MISPRFIRKYMRLAYVVGQDDNPCHSRKIGAVITDPEGCRILGTGYNGPPPKTPHPDSAEYLREYFWPQLTDDDIDSLRLDLLTVEELRADRELREGGAEATANRHLINTFVRKYAEKKICPRRLVGAKSGERTELCSCGHAERHAITNAGCDLSDCVMFCWCGVPCLQCSDAIIQARIRTVHCLDADIYHDKSEWLLTRGGVEVMKHPISMFEPLPKI